MESDRHSLLKNILGQFVIYGECQDLAPFGTGHINQTLVSTWDQAGRIVRYTHQRINEKVFVHPDQVMTNIRRVTGQIAAQLTGVSGWSRRVLTVVPARSGEAWVRDAEGGWWRTYLFIEGAHTLELASSPGEARVLGRSAALFQKQLMGLGEPRLYETIPGFHDMERRYARFHEALGQDPLNRAAGVQEEIDFLRENEERGGILTRALKTGAIPERICHNDTKMNNILLDDADSEALCVIDLDTVMPGSSLFDLGDLIRTVTNRALEDERDLSLVEFDLGFFEALLEGFLSEAVVFLTAGEKALLCESGRAFAQIMGLRFLMDYLEGDQYYRIDRPGHNLDRCRTQIALIRSMDRKWEEALKIARTHPY